ncbi:MAG: ABC transporter substrate-binding protein [Deltaproteobacteria bacterium]|nr:ABC transporter substrate-binding protein [Deltaproteobacteria bacterium]
MSRFRLSFITFLALSLLAADFQIILADTLRMVYPLPPVSLDPQRYPPDPAAWPVIMTSYKRLFDLKPGTTELDNTDSAATTYRISDDGLIYTILLREGQTFSDGSPVDSYAALFTFDRLMSSETGRVYFGPLRFLEIVGPYTFRFRLDRPWAPFISALTTPMASLISPGLATKSTGFLDRRTLGSGRFEAELVDDSSLTMKIRADSATIPKLDRVEFFFEPDEAQRVRVMVEKEAHLAWGTAASAGDNYLTLSVPTFETKFVAFNLARPYLKLDGIREAISLLISAAFAGQKEYRVAGFGPAGLLPGFDPGPAANVDPIESRQRAAEILTRVGPTRVPLDLVYWTDDPAGRQDAEILAASLSAGGLSVRLVPLSGNHGRGILEKRDFDLLLDRRRPWLPSPEMWLGGFLDSRSSIDGNPAGFTDSAADSLIAEMSTVDRAERDRVLKRLTNLALDQRPYKMIYQKPLNIVVDQRLAGLKPHPMWPEVWPVESVNLDPFKPKVQVLVPEPPQGPLIKSFDHPVAEPYE